MDSVLAMSLTSPRRDQRRRLLVAWTRPTDEAAASGAAPRPASAAPAPADPSCQATLGLVAPTGVGGFALTAVLLLAPAVIAATVTAWEPATGRPLLPSEGRFAATLRMIRSGFDPAAAAVPEWIAQLSLCLAAAYALAVRSVQRHRRDDYVGRHRAWGWLAVVFVSASLAGATPLGPVVATAFGDATGMRPGPDGAAWWIGISTVIGAATVAWAVLPLRERSTTAVWLTALALAWTASATGGWLTASGTAAWEHQVLATRIAWWAGCSFALVAMLAATRAVIRDIRGLVAPRSTARRQRGRASAATPAAAERRPAAAARPTRPEPAPAADTLATEDDDDSTPRMTIAAGGETPDFTDAEDDDDDDMRHLSKSERKRLRKLRRQRAAA
jgi:hypothetical protein